MEKTEEIKFVCPTCGENEAVKEVAVCPYSITIATPQHCRCCDECRNRCIENDD